MKKLGAVIVVILVVLVAVVLARNTIAKNAISAGVKVMTGLDLTIKSMNVGIFKSIIGIEELQLQNPAGFQDKIMVDMPEIYVDYDLGAFLKKRVHFEQINLNLKELTVVKNEKGELNLNSLKVFKDKQEPSAKKGEFKIDVLQLKIDKVIYKDYSQGISPKTMEFNLNIDERYENITDANKLIGLIVTKALMNTTIAKLADFDLGSLQTEAGDLLKGATKSAQDAFDKAKQEGEKATDKIKDILPF